MSWNKIFKKLKKGMIMNNDIEIEKYRKLSVSALVMGIIGFSSIALYNLPLH